MVTKTVVFDDDPTGTQSATGVEVVLDDDPRTLAAAMSRADAVYVLTNTRALDEPAAVARLTRLRDGATAAATASGDRVRFVLRGDSTLRGHVFAEIDVLAEPDSVVLFVPAFPAGGRTTRSGIHHVRIDGRDIPAHETEFAQDPVFPFAHSYLPDYVAEKSTRPALTVSADDLRDTLLTAAAGTVLIPDVETDADIARIATAVTDAWATRPAIVVRCAAPLAASLAGVLSQGMLPTPLLDHPAPTLLICGSHTGAAGRQLARVEAVRGRAEVVDTERALHDAAGEGARVAAIASAGLESGFAAIASERARRADHGSLADGERVMAALIEAVRRLRGECEVVVSKGGITGAEVAAAGLGATTARVLGQIMVGVSVWQLETPEGRQVLQVVVPGNVGDDAALVDALAAI